MRIWRQFGLKRWDPVHQEVDLRVSSEPYSCIGAWCIMYNVSCIMMFLGCFLRNLRIRGSASIYSGRSTVARKCRGVLVNFDSTTAATSLYTFFLFEAVFAATFFCVKIASLRAVSCSRGKNEISDFTNPEGPLMNDSTTNWPIGLQGHWCFALRALVRFGDHCHAHAPRTDVLVRPTRHYRCSRGTFKLNS